MQGPQGDRGEQGIQGPQGEQGEKGDTGATGPQGTTFTPSVSSEGVISWTNDGGLANPASVNIKGPQGEPGPHYGKASSVQITNTIDATYKDVQVSITHNNKTILVSHYVTVTGTFKSGNTFNLILTIRNHSNGMAMVMVILLYIYHIRR